MSRPITVLYIGGYGRSGSTLLERMFGLIPGFFSVGELRHIWERSFKENQLCGCGEAFYSCEFWNPLVNEVFGDWNKVNVDEILAMKRSVDRLRYIPYYTWFTRTGNLGEGIRKRLKDYGTILDRLYHKIQDHSGANVIVDSSKDPSYAFMLNTLPYFDLRLVHLVRDSRAVVYSWLRQRVRPEIKDRREFMPRFSPIKSSLEWNLYNYALDYLAKRMEHSSLLRYEDLVNNPARFVYKTLNDLNLAPTQLPLTDEKKLILGKNHTVSGNPMRFQNGLVEIRPDEEWRIKMRARDRHLTTCVTLDLLRRYSYFGTEKRA